MNRRLYLDLAASGLAIPIGTDVVLQEHSDPGNILLDGLKLGQVVEQSARRYHSPLGIPLMDLQIERSAILEILNIPGPEVNSFHFTEAPREEIIQEIDLKLNKRLSARMQATCTGIQYIHNRTKLIPVGMCIGPFSLMTKLMDDPISAVYLYGLGAEGNSEPLVATLLGTLKLSTVVISRYIRVQIAAGAKLIIMCEPAANMVYISPKQIEKGSDVFDRCVIQNISRIKKILDDNSVDLFLHDCGELTDIIVEKFSQLNPAILSLGSSRQLWKDARLVSPNTVLYGNLPSKKFYSDELISPAELKTMAEDLVNRMREVGHPFILGSECDVLSVPGYHQLISEKVKIITDVSKYQVDK